MSPKGTYFDKFILAAKQVHGDQYDYSFVPNSIKSTTKITILCPHHGSFIQTPNKHTSAKQGCPECSKQQRSYEIRKSRALSIIKKYVQKYGDTYEFEPSADFKDIEVACKRHNTNYTVKHFNNAPVFPCKQCAVDSRSRKITKSHFDYINEARAIHDGVYDYHIVNDIIYAMCPNHGEFKLIGNVKSNHIHRKSGCPECKKQTLNRHFKKDIQTFIQQAREVHSDTYDYSDITHYTNTHTPVPIICSIHGTFMQIPLNHLMGAGCWKCKRSTGESLIADILNRESVNFEPQHTFEGCRNKRLLRFDFYLPDYNTVIEYDGPHHYFPVKFKRDMTEDQVLQAHELTKKNDEIKNAYCKSNNISLYRIPYTDIDSIEPLIYELINIT